MAVGSPKTFSTEGQPQRAATEGGEPLLNTIKGLPMACYLFEGNFWLMSVFQRTKIKAFQKARQRIFKHHERQQKCQNCLDREPLKVISDSESPFSVTQGSMISIEQMDAHSPCLNARRQLLFLYNSLFILEGRQGGRGQGTGQEYLIDIFNKRNHSDTKILKKKICTFSKLHWELEWYIIFPNQRNRSINIFFLRTLCWVHWPKCVHFSNAIYNGKTDGRSVGNTHVFKAGTSDLYVKLSHNSIGQVQSRNFHG